MVKIFSIEGSIGSGKSTLIRKLKETFFNDWVFVLEPIAEWNDIKDNKGENILTKFYKDQQKYAFSFQMMAYISRLARLKQIIKKNPGAIIITERSIFADRHVFAKMLYDDNKIEEVNYIIYLKWFDEFIEEVKQDGIIYLQVTPETCYNRVQKRDRDGETISLEYLNSCHKYHEKWLAGEKNVLLLNGEQDFENNLLTLGELWKKINRFINHTKWTSLGMGEMECENNLEWKEISHC